jgi:hypothetical protein
VIGRVPTNFRQFGIVGGRCSDPQGAFEYVQVGWLVILWAVCSVGLVDVLSQSVYKMCLLEMRRTVKMSKGKLYSSLA